MTGLLLVALTVLISYLVGAIPFGYLIARWRGVDILKVGSGNIGATNVGRVLGRRFGILVFILDFAKGAVPVGAAIIVRSSLKVTQGSGDFGSPIGALPVLAGLSAFVGHLFPVFLRFHGGKGVATGAGVVAVLLPGPAFAALITWVAIVGLTRYVSLASLSAGVSLCLFHLLLTPNPFASGIGVRPASCQHQTSAPKQREPTSRVSSHDTNPKDASRLSRWPMVRNCGVFSDCCLSHFQ